MTIQDLLRHTSGLTYGVFGKSLVKQKYHDANLFDANQTLARIHLQTVEASSRSPARDHVGLQHVDRRAGRVVEVVSGMPFDQFVAERITKPLGMSSTGFYVTGEDIGRIAEPQIDPETQKRPNSDRCDQAPQLAVRWWRHGLDSRRLPEIHRRCC